MDCRFVFFTHIPRKCIYDADEWFLHRQVDEPKYLIVFLRKSLGLEFELGLELDSAEVRGILLYNNQEWGRFASSEIPVSIYSY